MQKAIIILITFFILLVSFTKSTNNLYPEKLSDWKIFKGKLAELKPVAGVVPYSLNTPLYTDYAEKSRFVRLPKGKTVLYKPTGVLDFPEGTLLVKNFYYSADFRRSGLNKQIIETRLLIHETDGWKALTYVWNDQQTEAVLEIAGDEKNVQFINKEGDTQLVRYVVPNQNQCKGCHNFNETIMPIGPSVGQLNGKLDYSTGTKNQIDYWKANKMMTNIPANAVLPKTAVWNDPKTGSLDARARAYLEINCAHCHRREGPAQTSGLFLTASEKDPTAIGINKPPVAAGTGSGGRLVDILPGNAKASIFWYRMHTTNPGERMPELGRNLIHKEGLELVREWIDKMK